MPVYVGKKRYGFIVNDGLTRIFKEHNCYGNAKKGI